MTTNDSKSGPTKPAATARAERLAAELRANLKRRKDKARAVAPARPGPPGQADPAETTSE